MHSGICLIKVFALNTHARLSYLRIRVAVRNVVHYSCLSLIRLDGEIDGVDKKNYVTVKLQSFERRICITVAERLPTFRYVQTDTSHRFEINFSRFDQLSTTDIFVNES